MDVSKLSRNYKEDPLKLGEKPTKEDLEYLYLKLNWSREEVAKFIGKSEAQTKKYLAIYKFRKTQEQKAEIRKRTTLAKYGVENISQLKEIKEKKEQKALEKYGTKNVSQAEEVKNKIKATNLEKYGYEVATKDKKVQDKIRETNLEKYGCEYATQSEEVKNKIKATNLEKYGYEVATKAEEVKNKIKITNRKRYGANTPLQSEEVKNKIKATNLEKYGVEWSSQREDIKDKIKATNLEKYGYFVSSKNEKVKEKAKNTCLERYGMPYPINKDIQDKVKKTNLEKYGTEYAAASSIIREKIKTTCLEKYGAETNLSLSENKEKVKQTNLKRYGSISPMQNEKVKEKAKNTCLERYGYENPMLSPEINRKQLLQKYSAETLKVLESPESLKEFINKSENKDITTLAKNLNVAYSTLNVYCHKYNLWNSVDHASSRYEAELQELFPHMHKTKSAIAPYEIDLYDEERKFGIEFNGNYWHSELKIADHAYHQKKSLVAEDAGIFLYHIWEYEWQDPIKREKILSQIKNILGKNDKKVYARNCYVKEIRRETAEVFIDAYHMQGYTSDSIRFGLYDNTELLAVMTFGKPRFKSDCEYELIRYCSKAGVSVVGGASKLFKEFIRNYNPKSVLSYSHIDKGTGKLYDKLGFSLVKISDPDYVWCDGEETLSRYQCQKHKLNKIGFEGSEREIMDGLGFFRIFGCGNKVWKWSESK